MGNQLTRIAPSQILGVELYLTDVANYEYDCSLGSTRFLKVARARVKEGYCVVKVFAIIDPLLRPIAQTHLIQLEDIKHKLINAHNCIPFQKTSLSDKAVLVFRQYANGNLYDRISTRPFLNVTEKKWLAFQLLCALNQCHRQGVCHGDIKSENVLITGWNWLLLTDFASFKPAYLPFDNPADFNFFFDTSRRRTCYIAPERFIEGAPGGRPLVDDDLSTATPNTDTGVRGDDLTPAMDIFSAGCVIAEMFLEATPLFDLSQLLAYRSGIYTPDTNRIELRFIRNLVEDMIQADPSKRLTAEHYLLQFRGTAFPDYFYSFLQLYMGGFVGTPLMSPDDKITRLHRDINRILKALTDPSHDQAKSHDPANTSHDPAKTSHDPAKSHDQAKSHDPAKTSHDQAKSHDPVKTSHDPAKSHDPVKTSHDPAESSQENADWSHDQGVSHDDVESHDHGALEGCTQNEGLVIISSVITSCIRSLKYCNSKLASLDLLLLISTYIGNDVTLDRILPYMITMLNDSFPRVRAAAVDTITSCLCQIERVPAADANIFPEYILPKVNEAVDDLCVEVRVSYARNVAQLAMTALRFLEIVQLTTTTTTTEDSGAIQLQQQGSFDVELRELHHIVQQKVAILLSDPDNIVKETLVESGITSLCVFFGQQRANDLIMSHMITFLNDKHDWHLRRAFFDNVVGVAAYIGWRSSAILKPLLQQGICDPEEHVVTKAINAVTCLCQLKLIEKVTVLEFAAEILPFLCHPNIWVRHATVGFVSLVSTRINMADVRLHLAPLLTPFLKTPVVQLDKDVLVFSVLKHPIPRLVYDYILKMPSISQFFDGLQDRQLYRNLLNTGQMRALPEPGPEMAVTLRKLVSHGMKDEDEEKMLAMRDVMVKIHRVKQAIVSTSETVIDISMSEEQAGMIDLNNLSIQRRHATLQKPLGTKRPPLLTPVPLRPPPPPQSRDDGEMSLSVVSSTNTVGDTSIDNNTLQPLNRPQAGSKTAATTVAAADSEGGESTPPPTPTLVKPEPRQAKYQVRHSACFLELRSLVTDHQKQYSSESFRQEQLGNLLWEIKSPPSGWRPKGQLVAHLHEHKAAINRLQVSDDHILFATCSNDGTTKLWDSSKIEGKSMTNRSRQTFNNQGGQIRALSFCQGSTCIATASDNNTILISNIDTSTQAKMSVLNSIDLSSLEYGQVVDLHHFDSGSESVLAYATTHGFINGFDLRSNKNAWTLRNDPKYGLVTSFIVEPMQSWLALGTSCGTHVCWDMRFQLPISQIHHPTGARVRRLLMHPMQPSCIISAAQGNNEISVWDIETGARRLTLWASTAPPLSLTQASSHSVQGLYCHAPDNSMFILAAGSDQRLRYWDLAHPASSYIVAGAASDPPNHMTVSYQSRFVDGTEVIQETYSRRTVPMGGVGVEDIPRRGPDTPPVGHRDCITDIAVYQASQMLVVSTSRDGMIKVWK